ncbi:uncharacterized protein BO97DRAFT_419445 [Aspergillus homomorphus CBS 101889]|uniref:Uncharacterized protein n=1 Tax=Aspergillus homomorphus (strain CBS 101889) TaxID=1450537 RepID=A0A395IDI0_ASPHC|nr:hypothetical protein BO97DRAFT_419445 [Aspergillus homomorphus CBS 101889]RAL17198.1 hypothetical protein BO97DRAFT_419445 [Aspergillus homomorphus CBS 101889]
MPIPIPSTSDQATQSSSSATGNPNTTTTTSQSSSSSLNTDASRSEADKPLSKEEADRLYEERMEEEYAKREGATATPDNSDYVSPEPGSLYPRHNLATQTITIPEIHIPTSIESVLMTALPTSYLSQLANPTARVSLISEIREGLRSEWYTELPADAKHFFSKAHVGAGMCHATSRGGAPAPAATRPVPGVVGVAAVLGVINAL